MQSNLECVGVVVGITADEPLIGEHRYPTGVWCVLVSHLTSNQLTGATWLPVNGSLDELKCGRRCAAVKPIALESPIAMAASGAQGCRRVRAARFDPGVIPNLAVQRTDRRSYDRLSVGDRLSVSLIP